jgi:hypothetical protein
MKWLLHSPGAGCESFESDVLRWGPRRCSFDVQILCAEYCICAKLLIELKQFDQFILDSLSALVR